ncbi:MAG: exosortase O, partial [Microcoleus sp. SIO2G3]|nr:exosortase O [Microcoleus sp. SIO2G3]
RWLIVCAANIGLLVIANIARVFTLVFVLQILQQPAIAQTLHVPLGIANFMTVCAIAWLLLRWVPRHVGKLVPYQPAAPTRSPRMALVTIACLLLFTSIPRPTAIAARSIDLAQMPLPATMQTEAIALNAVEQNFFASYPGATAQKQQFEFQGLKGDLLLVASSSWQAHHSPELCLISSGLAVSQMQQQQFTPDVVGRWMLIDGDRQSALYWFQSPHRTTDDFLDRIWGEVSRQDSDWVLVSILFDAPESPDRPAVRSLVNALHQSIAQELRS